MLNLEEAARLLKAGGIVIYPTETFWAIGCMASNPASVAAVAKIKERPSDKAFPLIAADAEQSGSWADMTACPSRLVARFWPGPLTLALPLQAAPAPAAVSHLGMTAVRVSSAREARELAKRAGAPLVATSANCSGNAPVTEAASLAARLLENCCKSGLEWGIVQASQEMKGSPSTLVIPLRKDGGWQLKILREGAVSRSELADPEWETI